MVSKIILVTDPDDVLLDGIRLTLVNLSKEQNWIVSSALQKYEGLHNVIVYIQDEIFDPSWMLDKKNKSDLLIFNAESKNQTIVGYLSGLNNSYYFGTLRDLNKVNNRVLFTEDDCLEILNYTIGKYERRSF